MHRKGRIKANLAATWRLPYCAAIPAVLANPRFYWATPTTAFLKNPSPHTFQGLAPHSEGAVPAETTPLVSLNRGRGIPDRFWNGGPLRHGRIRVGARRWCHRFRVC